MFAGTKSQLRENFFAAKCNVVVMFSSSSSRTPSPVGIGEGVAADDGRACVIQIPGYHPRASKSEQLETRPRNSHFSKFS